MTSHDVVARVRRLAGTRKVGHAGTLDPMATGVLVLGVNRATRLLGHLMLTEKAYDATVRLGVATTTDDAEGEVAATASTGGLDEAAVRAALAEFVGDIEQVPTAVSAIKVDGKRAYQRVRDGEEVELKARPVTVHELVVHDVAPRRRAPRRRRLGALLQRHLHPRDRPRPRRPARRRRPPHRAAAYGGRPLRPRPRAHTLDELGRRVRADADRGGRARGVPGARPRRGRRPPTSASAGPLDLDARRARPRSSRPTASSSRSTSRAAARPRPVAVFV